GGRQHLDLGTASPTFSPHTTDMEWGSVKGHGEAPVPVSSGGGRLVLCCGLVLVSVSFATRGQTDMRGLATAGRWFGWSRTASLGSSVANCWLVAHSCFAGCSSRCHQHACGAAKQSVKVSRP